MRNWWNYVILLRFWVIGKDQDRFDQMHQSLRNGRTIKLMEVTPGQIQLSTDYDVVIAIFPNWQSSLHAVFI